MYGDQRRSKSAKGNDQQEHRTDTTCREAPDKASEAQRLFPCQSHGTGAENRPWFELHIATLCHIVLICVSCVTRARQPLGQGVHRHLYVAYPRVKPGIADVYEEVNDYK